MSESRSLTVNAVLRALRTPFTLVVLLGILGYAAWWGYQKVTAPVPPPEPTPCVTQPIEKNRLQSTQVSLRIYNGGSKRGLAGDVAQAMRERGFIVRTVGNTEVEVTETVIVVQDKKSPEAKLVRAFFKDAVVKEEPGRTDRTVDVLVGSAYAGFNSKAKTSVKVKDSSICLPAPPSETPLD